MSLGWRALLGVVALGGCASTSPDGAFRDVAREVEQRSGQKISWSQEAPGDPQVDEAVERLLRVELTADGAVQIALLYNARLRATFEELSLGQADLVQAGLLKNPTFTAGITAWEKEHIDPNFFVQVEQDFLDLIALPMRKRVAATELEATKLRVGDEVLALAAEVRRAFYTAQAAELVAATQAEIADASATAAELAKRQHDAGTLNDLGLATERGMAAQVRLDQLRSQGEVAAARERLTRLLGLWGKQTGYRLAPRLPELPDAEAPLDQLERLAIERRLDVAAQRREVQALDYALSVSRTTRWTGFLNLTVEAARLRGEKRIAFGPSASIELPIFDQRQAAIARLEALKRQSEMRLRASAIEARSEVREAQVRLSTARAVVEQYGRAVVPLRERIVALSQQQYDAMLLGVYQLLQARQNEYTAYREYIEALRDYWIAHATLERAAGGRLTSPATTTLAVPPPTGLPPAGSASPGMPPVAPPGAPSAMPAHQHSPGMAPMPGMPHDMPMPAPSATPPAPPSSSAPPAHVHP